MGAKSFKGVMSAIIVLIMLFFITIAVFGCGEKKEDSGNVTWLKYAGNEGVGEVGYDGVTFEVPEHYKAVMRNKDENLVEISIVPVEVSKAASYGNDDYDVASLAGTTLTFLDKDTYKRNESGGAEGWKMLKTEKVNGHDMVVWEMPTGQRVNVFPDTPHGTLTITGVTNKRNYSYTAADDKMMDQVTYTIKY